MRSPFLVALFALVATPALAVPTPTKSSRAAQSSFKWGAALDWGMFHPTVRIADDKLHKAIARVKAGGMDHVRYELTMRETGDIATNPHNEGLRVVRAFRKANLDVIAVVGIGNVKALPKGLSVDDPGYIEKVTRNVRDVVTALKPLGVHTYQIENEINIAGMVTLPPVAWRSGKRWWDTGFKTQLLSRMAQAVREVDPTAKLTTNFADGGSDPVTHDLPRGKTPLGTIVTGLARTGTGKYENDLEGHLRAISPFVDDVGLDSYQYYALPFRAQSLYGKAMSALGRHGHDANEGERIAERVRTYAAVTGKPIRVAETGYESHSPTGHSAYGQDAYVRNVMRPIEESGAIGLTFFRLMDPVMKNAWWNIIPNHSIEPHFGLLDSNVDPKVAMAREWGTRQIGPLRLPWLTARPISAWASISDEIHDSRSRD